MVAFYSALSGDRDGLDTDRPQLHLDPAAIEAAVARQQVPRGGYYVFAPGAEFGPSKRWPERHYAALAAGLDLPVLLLGSGKDALVCDQIVQATGGRCRNLAGKTSLAEAFALIAGARAMVSNDSGLMHVAAAFGIPQVALFGSSSPLHTPPLNDRAQVLWLKADPAYQPPLDCAPCFQRDCPLGHHRCLEDVDAPRVAALLQAATSSA